MRAGTSTEGIGIIGCGSMGSMLLRRFAGMADRGPLLASTRSRQRLDALKDLPVTACASNRELVERCRTVFLCVKPLEIKPVLVEIEPCLRPDHHLVSIAGSVSLRMLATIHGGKATRMLPSILSEAGLGTSLVAHNQQVDAADRQFFNSLLNSLGSQLEIPESEFEIVSDLTSCGPGLFAALFELLLAEVLPHSSLEPAVLDSALKASLFGTASLAHLHGFGWDELVRRVATRGGATEAGVQVLREKLPAVFSQTLKNTLERQQGRARALLKDFPGCE